MERRKSIRFESASEISVSVVKPKGIEIEAAIKDVSRVGINLYVNKLLKKGQNLHLEIYILSRKKPIQTVARVRWVEKKPGAKSCLVGIEFVDIDKSDLADLLDSVYEGWKNGIPKIRF